ncbi:MAG: hypothetical protein ACOCYW_03990 [Roseicyclus sp.]
MLSIFTLSALGAFGVSNTLTDVTDHDDDDAERSGAGRHEAGDAEGLGGNGDLIAGLAAFADPGSGPVATPELSGTEALAAAPTGDSAGGGDDADGSHPQVIALCVAPPGPSGAGGPDAAQAGFRTALGPGDELTLNIAADLPGQILAVHALTDASPGEDAADLVATLNLYLHPEGLSLPDEQWTGPEARFIAALGLQKLGEVQMGRLVAHVHPESGETVVTEDSRQSGPPAIVANRTITEIGAHFA